MQIPTQRGAPAIWVFLWRRHASTLFVLMLKDTGHEGISMRTDMRACSNRGVRTCDFTKVLGSWIRTFRPPASPCNAPPMTDPRDSVEPRRRWDLCSTTVSPFAVRHIIGPNPEDLRKGNQHDGKGVGREINRQGREAKGREGMSVGNRQQKSDFFRRCGNIAKLT